MLSQTKHLLFQIEFQQNDSPYQSKLPDIYTSKFQELRHSIIQNLQEFIPIDVVPRPPPMHYIPTHAKLNRCAYFDSKRNKIVEYPRKNAFEVYVDNYLLFSRLDSGTWPDVSAICEWALRIAEKMVDLEIEKEEATIQDKTRDLRDDRDQAIQNEVKTERLPPVSRGFQRTLRTKPEKSYLASIQPRSRYASLKVDDETLPYGIDPMHNTHRKMPFIATSHKRKQVKSIDKEIRTVPRGSRSQSRDQSFHWHLKQKSNTKLNQFQGRQNQIHINTFQMPTKPQNVELTPLPAVNERATEERKQEEGKLQGPVKVDVKISESSLNCYLPHYKLEGNKVTKTCYDGVWSTILCENPLPLTGEYYFHIIVKSSKENQVQLGIAPLTYYPRADQPHKPDSLLSFNCGTGQIKDSKHNNFSSETNWRQGGIKLAQETPFHFIAVVNMKSKVIEWHVNEKIVASAKIPSQFNNGFRAFVSLHNCQDVVMLNDKVHKMDEPKLINDLILNKSLMVDRDELANETANVFVQTIDNNQPAVALPVLQNRIYANSKVKEHFQEKIDESVQTIPTFQGRIKRQRLQRIVEKHREEEERQRQREKEKQVFNQQDLEVLKKAENQIETVTKEEAAPIVEVVHKEKRQHLEPTETVISPSIRDQSQPEMKEVSAQEQPRIPEQKEANEDREVIEYREVVEQEREVIEEKEVVQEKEAVVDIQIVDEKPIQARQSIVQPNQEIINEAPEQEVAPTQEEPQQPEVVPLQIIPTQQQPQPPITEPLKEQPQTQTNALAQSRHSSQNGSIVLQWTATYDQGSFRLEQAKPIQQ